MLPKIARKILGETISKTGANLIEETLKGEKKYTDIMMSNLIRLQIYSMYVQLILLIHLFKRDLICKSIRITHLVCVAIYTGGVAYPVETRHVFCDTFFVFIFSFSVRSFCFDNSRHSSVSY